MAGKRQTNTEYPGAREQIMKRVVRIATRKSPLAIWQATYVKEQLETKYPEMEIKLHSMLTTADKMLSTPLSKIGGKGLFVKELEKAMLDHSADLAVHSIKDMPSELPEGLLLGVILKREDPRDAFVSNQYASLQALPKAAIVGTSSLRRKAQILAMRPDLIIKSLRGNVGTRLQKLDAGEFDAIILAAAGLKRLNFEARIKTYFSIDEMLPAAGQGAIGIECRKEDSFILQRLSFLNDSLTHYSVMAERTLNQQLGGSCQFPIATYAQIKDGILSLKGLVSNKKGDIILRTTQEGPFSQAIDIGLKAANHLIEQGARELLQAVLRDQCDDTGD